MKNMFNETITIRVVSSLFTISMVFFSVKLAYAFGNVYEIEPGLKGNFITLDALNKTSTTLDNLIAVVDQKPSWINVNSVNFKNATLPPDSVVTLSIVFEVLSTVKVGEQGDVTITLSSNGHPIARKTVSLSVALPKTYKLEQNFPNPFNPTTSIGYALPKSGSVILKIYNLIGEEVRSLVEAEQSAGTYTVTFDASGLASGIYFYRLATRGFIDVKKMILLK